MQALTLAMQSGETLPDEFLAQIAQTLELLYNRLEETESNIVGVNGPTSPPGLDPGAYPSSNVNAYKYDPRSGTLFVKFHGKDSAGSGPTYRYEGVPRNIYDVFSKGRVAPKTSGQNQYHRWIKGVTPSLGASLNALIKNGGFSYQKVA